MLSGCIDVAGPGSHAGAVSHTRGQMAGRYHRLSGVCTFLQHAESGITACYTMRLTQLGEDRETSDTPELADAVKQYDKRDNERAPEWNRHFN